MKGQAPTLALLTTSASLLFVSCNSARSHAPEASVDFVRHMNAPHDSTRSLAFEWVDVMLEAAAREVERIGAAPTVLSRQMGIPMIAMYEAWAAYDDVALGSVFGDTLRRPVEERTMPDRRAAISYAMYVACVDQYPADAAYLEEEMRGFGYDPFNPDTAAAKFGSQIGGAIVAMRHRDGANQLGDEPGSSGRSYSDTTEYAPVNTPDSVTDPDRWQPIPFDDGEGGQLVLGFLTPHWHLVEPFGLESADQFRPGPPPLVGSAQLKEEVDEVIAMNASLDPDQKALVEFMRDGPRSTGQSGHWMRFAQDVSIRDDNDLDEDVALFFAVGVTAMDAFIASWDAKRHYDSSRPWTLVRHYYAGQKLRGWGGPGQGVVEILGDEWHPYSPATFVTPPFPGYVSGHSTVSAACAEMLRLHTGSDRFGVLAERTAGELTEGDASCDDMQRVLGEPPHQSEGEELTCDVDIRMSTFTEAAEIAGLSRVLGGYHIQADNVAGLVLGRDVAGYLYPKIRGLLDGTAHVDVTERL